MLKSHRDVRGMLPYLTCKCCMNSVNAIFLVILEITNAHGNVLNKVTNNILEVHTTSTCHRWSCNTVHPIVFHVRNIRMFMLDIFVCIATQTLWPLIRYFAHSKYLIISSRNLNVCLIH